MPNYQEGFGSVWFGSVPNSYRNRFVTVPYAIKKRLRMANPSVHNTACSPVVLAGFGASCGDLQ